MTTFRSLTADRRPLEEFRKRVSKVEKTGTAVKNALPLHIFEWSRHDQVGSEVSAFIDPTTLQSRGKATIRVIFAPQDVPHPATVDGMCSLFESHRIPSAFIAEGLQGVSQSFSARKDERGTCAWFHLLCKDIATSSGQMTYVQRGERGNLHWLSDRSQAERRSQADFTWLKPGFVLKVRDTTVSPRSINQTATSSIGSQPVAAPDTQPEVELFCFGAPVTLRDRFRNLKETAACDELLKDPYVLLEVILNEMHKVMDQTGWKIADIFGKIETRTLEISSNPGQATKTQLDFEFEGLHNLAKHTIYLRENYEAALATIDGLREHHEEVCGQQPNPSQADTRQGLKYQRTLFQSTQRRLTSLDTRISNLVQLSFHIVAQGDSRLMQNENQSMKTIAVMTLLFLPLSTVSSIFGSQFMNFDDGPGHHLAISQDFWLMWAIAVPLTIMVIVVWRVWYADAKRRLTGEIPRDAERYMGWHTLRQTLQGRLDGKDRHHVVTPEVTNGYGDPC